jgi:hypothetical protein
MIVNHYIIQPCVFLRSARFYILGGHNESKNFSLEINGGRRRHPVEINNKLLEAKASL